MSRRSSGAIPAPRPAPASGPGRTFESLDQVLDDPSIDAVHLCTPVRFHVEGTLAALAAGKHVACAVPMATTLEDLRRVVEAVRASGLRYMMMETAVYTREFLFARSLDFGKLTFLRGSHIQDIEGLPDYWRGYPFMLYATHAVAPLLALAGTPPPPRPSASARAPFPITSSPTRATASLWRPPSSACTTPTSRRR